MYLATANSGAAVYFFIAITTTTAGAVSFDLEAIWAQIRAVRSPGPAVLPDVTPTAPITPAPLPPKVRAGRIWKAARIVGTFVVGGLMLAAFPQWGALIVIVSIGCLVWAVASKVHDGGEGERRRQALRQAQMHWETIERRWQQEAGEDRFIRKFQEWEQKHAEYRALPASYQRDLQQLHANRRAIQLHRFLAQHFIYQAKIDGIGPSLKTILVSYNIETAADLTSQAVRAVPGFGPARTKELLKWRAGIESIFRFDPRAGVDPKDSAALDQAYDKKRRDLQTGLLRGPHELEQERSRILRQRADMMTELRQAAIPLAQAIADVTLL